MKVKDLIEELLKHDLEKMVVVQGYEEGFSEIDETKEINLTLNAYKGRHWCGPHKEDESGECAAVLIW